MRLFSTDTPQYASTFKNADQKGELNIADPEPLGLASETTHILHLGVILAPQPSLLMCFWRADRRHRDKQANSILFEG